MYSLRQSSFFLLTLNVCVLFFTIEDKNQYVHRRDSVSLVSLSDQEIQKRMKLGLVTNPPTQRQNHQQNDEQEDDDDDAQNDRMEQWDDLEDSDDDDDRKRIGIGGDGTIVADNDKEEYIFDTKRRSSIDLDSMSQNLHDLIGAVDFWDKDADSHDNLTAKRRCSQRPSVASIQELDICEDEEIETLSGDDIVIQVKN